MHRIGLAQLLVCVTVFFGPLMCPLLSPLPLIGTLTRKYIFLSALSYLVSCLQSGDNHFTDFVPIFLLKYTLYIESTYILSVQFDDHHSVNIT